MLKNIIFIIEDNVTYNTFDFFEDFLFDNMRKSNINKKFSRHISGKLSNLIIISFGVLRAIHILFINSMFFYNLQKFIFKFRTNIAITIIIEIHS